MTPARILVVEDEAIVARDIMRQLEQLGYAAVADTARGEEAVEMAERLHPDLVLMDIQLAGGMDGVDAAQRIRERLGTPVVFLTAFASPGVMQRAKTAGPFGYLVKPFDPVQLGAAIEVALHQREVEIRLRQSREELATILRLAMDAFWLIDMQWRILDVNEAACAMLGHDRAGMLRLLVQEIEAAESPDDFCAHIEKVRREGSDRFETRHRCSDGRVLDVEASVRYLPVGEGRIFCFFRDITERKRTEEEREATVRLLGLINSQHDLRGLMREVAQLLGDWSGCGAVGIRIRDGEDYPYLETRGFSAGFVASESRLCERDPAGRVVRDADGYAGLECACGDVLRGRFDPVKPFFTSRGSFWSNSTTRLLEDFPVDCPLGARNGCSGEGFESVALVPLRVGSTTYGLLQLCDRRPGCFSAERIALLERLATNLAVAIAQRQAQSELRASELRYRLLLESTTDYTYTIETRADGRVLTRHGAGCRKVTGYSTEELASQPQLWIDMVLPEDRPAVLDYAARISAGAQPPPLEHRIVHRDGSIRWVRSSVVVRPNDNERTVHEGVITDITERKAAEDLLLARLELSELGRTGTMEELLQKAIDAAERHTGSMVGFFHFVDADRGEITLQTWSTGTRCNAGKEGLLFAPEQDGAWADCVRNRLPVVRNDPAGTAGRQGAPPRHIRVARELAVPILRGDRVVAVVGVGNKPAGYTERDVAAVQQLASMVMDQVDRKRAEAALRESEQRHRALFDSALQGVVYLDPAGSFVDANPAACRILGYEHCRLVALKATDPAWEAVRDDGTPFPGEEHPTMVAVRTGQPVRNVAMGMRIPGRADRVWILLDAVPEYPPGGARPLRVFAVFSDITERRQIETALRASEAKFARAFHSAPVMVTLSSLEDGTFLEVNEEFLRVSGYSAAEVVGRSAVDIGWLAADDRRRLLAGLLAKGRVTGLEFSLKARDGRRVDCLYSGEVIAIEGRRRVLSISLDTTESKRLEAQFRQAQKMEAVGQLAGGVAHDFNNILVAILLHLGLLREESALDVDTRSMLLELEREAMRAVGLTRQLLAFSRRQVMQVKPVHLDDLLGNLLMMLRRLLGEHIAIEVRDGATVPQVKVDTGMIEQVVVNLCVNARDAMPQGGRLTLATDVVESRAPLLRAQGDAPAGRYVRLNVSDTGCGMDEPTRARLFEPFFTTKEPGRGTGLGLATVYGIVKQHGGWVEVESEVGRGSTFRVMLPAFDAAPRVAAVAEPGALPRGQNETVLVVEDEPCVRGAIASTLRRFGYAVLEAANGSEAELRWAECPAEVDLLLTDLVMPGGISGSELARRLRAERPSLRVVFCSGYTQSQPVPSGPGYAMLAKPFETGALLETVRKCLEERLPSSVRA